VNSCVIHIKNCEIENSCAAFDNWRIKFAMTAICAISIAFFPFSFSAIAFRHNAPLATIYQTMSCLERFTYCNGNFISLHTGEPSTSSARDYVHLQ